VIRQTRTRSRQPGRHRGAGTIIDSGLNYVVPVRTTKIEFASGEAWATGGGLEVDERTLLAEVLTVAE
jgi:hypothetical protein